MKNLLILFIILGFIFFILSNYIKQLEKYKKIVLFGIGICLLLFIVFSVKKDKIDLEKYDNTYLKDASSVSAILSSLDIAPYKDQIHLQTENEPYSLTVYLTEEMSLVRIYQKLEKDALILFSLISNVDEIIFERNGVSYHYYYQDLNALFPSSLREMTISFIEQRYEEYFFNGNGSYMGTIDGYSIVDESITCEETKEFLKRENDVDYFLKCSDITLIYLYKDKEKYLLKDKIEELEIEKLLRTNLNIIKENVSES